MTPPDDDRAWLGVLVVLLCAAMVGYAAVRFIAWYTQDIPKMLDTDYPAHMTFKM